MKSSSEYVRRTTAWQKVRYYRAEAGSLIKKRRDITWKFRYLMLLSLVSSLGILAVFRSTVSLLSYLSPPDPICLDAANILSCALAAIFSAPIFMRMCVLSRCYFSRTLIPFSYSIRNSVLSVMTLLQRLIFPAIFAYPLLRDADNIASSLSRNGIPQILSYIVIFLSVVAASVFSLLRAICFLPVPWLLANGTKEEMAEAKKSAKEVMKGKRHELILLIFAYIPRFALCILTCGVGFFIYLPDFFVSLSLFFRTATEDKTSDVYRIQKMKYNYRKSEVKTNGIQEQTG